MTRASWPRRIQATFHLQLPQRLAMKLFFVVLISLVLASGASAQQTEHLQKNAGARPFRYLLYEPEIPEDSQARLPLVLFLHGGGEDRINGFVRSAQHVFCFLNVISAQMKNSQRLQETSRPGCCLLDLRSLTSFSFEDQQFFGKLQNVANKKHCQLGTI